MPKRSAVVLTDPPKKIFNPKRGGSPTKAEKELVAQFVLDQPAEVTPRQVNALAKVLRRSKELTKQLIEDAKDNFVESAGRYVEIHREAVEAALLNGDSKSLEVAVKGSQWAIESLSSDGTRIVEQPNVDSGGVKVMVGIKLGGMNADKVE